LVEHRIEADLYTPPGGLQDGYSDQVLAGLSPRHSSLNSPLAVKDKFHFTLFTFHTLQTSNQGGELVELVARNDVQRLGDDISLAPVLQLRQGDQGAWDASSLFFPQAPERF